MPSDLNPEDLAELRTTLAKAVLPWRVRTTTIGSDVRPSVLSPTTLVVEEAALSPTDARLIVAAVNALPALLEREARLTEALEEIERSGDSTPTTGCHYCGVGFDSHHTWCPVHVARAALTPDPKGEQQ